MSNLQSEIDTKAAPAEKNSGESKETFALGSMPVLAEEQQKGPSGRGTVIKNLQPVKTPPPGKTKEGETARDAALREKRKPLRKPAAPLADKRSSKVVPIRLKKAAAKITQEDDLPMKPEARRSVRGQAISRPAGVPVHSENEKTPSPAARQKAAGAAAEARQIFLKQAMTKTVEARAQVPVAKPGPQVSKARPTESTNSAVQKAKAEAEAHKAKSSKTAAAKKPEDKTKAPPQTKKEALKEPLAEGPSCDLNAAPKGSHVTQIFYTVLILILFAGWFYSGEEIITAKEGLGYYMGIAGGAMMLALIIYPLRKTARFMRGMGAIRHWFSVHMVLGLIGPMLVIFHANFEIGSLNSAIALGAMILVALSGLVGRHIYAGIHYGLYGKEMDLKGLKKDFERKISVMKYILDYAPALQQRLADFDSKAARPHYSFMGSLLGLVTTSLGAMWLRLTLIFGLRRTLRVAARRNQWSAAELKAHTTATRSYISSHISAAKAISRFKVYERLFSLWHLLHMPLFLMLVLTAVIHVVAVHMF
ncbi:MAG: hypothetical protein ACE5DW_05150 [Thermodesulfobacteriota bacterium]